ncbi:MAG TPA: GNAT family N-acetyltransferase [Pirellulales bacterium]|jgi:GNAT superfamily N-acetyltransferase|nr:GNAT family N-acetyltransferase [Pirellulales bacterium]
MVVVQQLRLVLEAEPPRFDLPGFTLRHYRGPDDIDRWLELRQRAFARQRVGVGTWSRADFERELLMKPWWRPERVWFAEPRGESSPVGMVTLAERGRGTAAVPVVHWLALLPTWRRRGIGRLLMNAVHRAVWNAGGREIRLETHSAWTAAGKLYEALGYVPVPAPSP